ncbi:MAG: TlpA family protein disulfide reductase [Acidimicrobiia bacterium]
MPVVDQVANDYLDDIDFVAIAGRGSLDATRDVADGLFSDNLMWGLDNSVWDLYGVRGQPTSLLVSDGVVVDLWFGQMPASEMRERLDNLVSLSS